MIVSTQNCAVSVLVENSINKPKFLRVRELDKVKAIKRIQTAITKSRAGDQRKTFLLPPRENNLSITITEKQNNEKQV